MQRPSFLTRIHRFWSLLFLITSVAGGRLEAADFSARTYSVGNKPVLVVLRDFNGDDHIDIAVLNNGSSDITVLLGRGDGTFTAGGTFGVGGHSTSISAADFNQDGNVDIVLGGIGIPVLPTCGASAVNILFGKGDGTFQPARQAIAVDLINNLVTAGDVDGDGKIDLVAKKFPQNAGFCPASGFSIFLGNGDGTFQPEREIASAVLDFNADGISDLQDSGGGSGPGMNIFLGQGNGQYKPLNDGPETNSGLLTFGDFNKDGNQDKATMVFEPCGSPSCSGGTTFVGIALGNGDGSFQQPNLFPPGGYQWRPGVGGGITQVAPGEFSGDGNLDVAFINSGSGVINFLLGNGDGYLPNLKSFDTGSGPGSIVVADLNADGRADVVATNLNDDTVTVLLNTTLDFFLTTDPKASSVAAGSSVTTTISIGPEGFNETVSIACSAPASQGVNCSVSPSSVSPGESAVMTVTTTGVTVARHSTPDNFQPWLYCFGLPVAGVAVIGFRSGRRVKERVKCASMVASTLLLIVGSTQLACGGGHGGDPKNRGGTPPGNYSITVTGTSEALQRSTTFTVAVN